MIFAAGEGRRLRPQTLLKPKPLIPVSGVTLLERHLVRLAAFGVQRVVINVHHLKEQIIQFVGQRNHWGLDITFLEEKQLLDTGGGLARALPLLGDQPFVVVSGDIWTDFDFNCLPASPPADSGHLILVDNPAHNPEGDFSLKGTRVLMPGQGKPVTYGGIALLQPQFLQGHAWPERFPLRDAFNQAIREGRLFGQITRATWADIGTPERLAAFEAGFSQSPPASRDR